MNLREPPATPPLLKIARATVLRDERAILDELSLSIADGQHTAILGPNGSGKSTLVKLIARLLYPLAHADGSSSVEVFGRARWRVEELRSLLGIVSPALERDYTSETPLEVFETVLSGFFGARGLGLTHQVSEAMRQRAEEALRRIDAWPLCGRQMETLSSGEVRRVMIARALVHRPRALLLDEPCAGLDMASRRQFLETLRGLAREGTTLLLVTHHIEEILPEIGHVVMLKAGRMCYHGDKAMLLDDAHLSELFDAPVSVSRRGAWYASALD